MIAWQTPDELLEELDEPLEELKAFWRVRGFDELPELPPDPHTD